MGRLRRVKEEAGREMGGRGWGGGVGLGEEGAGVGGRIPSRAGLSFFSQFRLGA